MDRFEGTSLEAIGLRLRVSRAVFGLGQEEFGAKAGLKKNTYNQFEQGKTRPSLESAIALCKEFDLTLDWIYLGEGSTLRYDLWDAIKTEKQRFITKADAKAAGKIATTQKVKSDRK